MLIWATVVALACGLLDAGAPIDDVLRALRNLARSHDASGRIAVIGIDDRSVRQLGKWPIARRNYARLADTAREMGASRIYFDIDFAPDSTPLDDAALRTAFSKWSTKPVVATRFVIDPLTGRRSEHLPFAGIRPLVDLANINYRYNHQGAIWDLPYALTTGGQDHPSMSAHMAGQRGKTGEIFPIDYAIQLKSVPVYGLADLLDGKVPADALKGRTLIVGVTSPELGDRFLAPGTGLVPGVYMHVLGAETLREGRPLPLGWVPPFLVALLCAAGGIRLKRLRNAVALLALGGIALLAGPIALDAAAMPVDVLPALFLLIIASAARASAAAKKSYRERGTTNANSGLPNLEAFRHKPPHPHHLLIAARIRNFARIVSALPPDQERALVEQIAARLTLGAHGVALHQGDEGIFAWFADQTGAPVGDHLDALHALFRSPIVVQQQRFDLAIAFGVDPAGDRDIVKRLAGALVAADEAAAEGLRWKHNDPARLKSSEWKLSLLSQLDAAIDTGALWIAYQPKIEIGSGEIIGAEALARWTHPERGPISPDEFIRAAEQENRIDRLTMHILDRAVHAAARINARGIVFSIAVNLSTRLLDDRTLPGSIAALLERHQLPPKLLTLEITETAALITGGASLETLHALRALGIRISIDDYGTGQSTLDYLKRIPANEIKIDKSFVQLIDDNHDDRVMVRSTIELAHSLGHKVVAEGVERQVTLDRLEEMGCDIAQGYLIGRPMHLRALGRLLLSARRKMVA
ncbi:EAL domain-containing protein [Sphingomonas sp. 1P06PA]|uniref:EAL domain-containing protein n=1 Tax=Sphingomonas sp. 1P06PA TaxID=554121 RepID=UPI0039A475AE